MRIIAMPKIQLAHGNGGVETRQLIDDVFFKSFANELLVDEDSAIIETSSRTAYSTDSFTVSPIFFNGGDIGKLSVVGTTNDILMSGAIPRFMSAGFIIEEGFLMQDLQKIARSMSKELQAVGAKIVCGDTKVVPKGSVDGIFINTSCVGDVFWEISSKNIQDGDAIILSGDIARHGTQILQSRQDLRFDAQIVSDCKSLLDEVMALKNAGIVPVAMRDATRGGLSAVLNEFALSSSTQIEAYEEKIAVSQEVRGVCELFGFESYALANEGTFVVVVRPQDAQKACDTLRHFNPHANIIAHAHKSDSPKALLKLNYGAKRRLEMPSGELLPRIC